MSLTRQQLTLIGIFALFIGPLLLVMLMRSSWWQYQPTGMKNNGYLVQPPVSLAHTMQDDFDRKWLVLYAIEPPCTQKCIEDVTALRQIHRAVGRHADHLAILLISPTEYEAQIRNELEAIYPEFSLLVDTSGEAFETLTDINQTMQAGDANPGNARTFILDPMLNVMLAYTIDAKPNDIHKDLKRLLKWSDQEKR